MKERYPNFEVKKISSSDWTVLAASAHQAIFNEKRPSDRDRIDYALVVSEHDQVQSYLTAREFDKESVYWSRGGCFPTSKESLKAVYCLKRSIEWTQAAGYKRITMLIENDNIRHMKLCMKFGFRIIGVRAFEGSVLVEFLKDLTKELSDAE